MDQPNPFASSNSSKLALSNKHHRLNQENPFPRFSALSFNCHIKPKSPFYTFPESVAIASPILCYEPEGVIYNNTFGLHLRLLSSYPSDVALSFCLTMDGLGVKNQKKSKKQVKKAGIKVVYISSPVKVETSASEFRALVQELTGRDSDAEKYVGMKGGDHTSVENENLLPASTHDRDDPKFPHSSWEYLDQLKDDLMVDNQWSPGETFPNYYMPESSHVGLGGLQSLGAM